jgi:large subunit ribosomal protein L14
MIQMRSILDVADNSGARKIAIINPIGGSTGRYARLGDIVTASVQRSDARVEREEGTGRQSRDRANGQGAASPRRHATSGSIGNAAVLINDQGEPIGTRVFGPWRASCASASS